jgi:protein-disulfide isomerase
VESRIDDLVDAVIQEAARLGARFHPRAILGGPAAHGDPDIPRILDWS